jgi:hypothetical protein
MGLVKLRQYLMRTEDYINLEEKYNAQNYHPLDVVLNRGDGV